MLRITPLLLALGLTATAARAAPERTGPCASDQPEAGVGIRTFTGPGDLGRTPEACAASAGSIDTAGALTLDLDDFYGGIRIGAALHTRLALSDALWFSLGLPAVHWTYSANASIEAEVIDAGPLTLGAHLRAWHDETLQVAPYARLLLPTDTGYERAVRLGGELGAVLLVRTGARFELVVGAALTEVVVVNNPSALATTTAQVTSDATWRPSDWFSLALGIGLRLVPSEADVFESFDPRLGLRFYPWRGLAIDLSAHLPLAGRDRTTAAAMLSLGWIFGR